MRPNFSHTLTRLLRSTGFWDGLIMTGGTLLAGALDYGFNVVAGRLLIPVQYSVLVATISILQILLHVTNVIRNVVAYYTADLTTRDPARIAQFFRYSYRWAWRWGLVGAAVLGLASWPLGRLLNFDSPAPLWAASLALVMLFVRPITDGTLQGTQAFRQLASVNVTQALLRLGAAVLFIRWGWAAFGGVLALPVATFSALGLALWFLRPYRAQPTTPTAAPPTISGRYSAETFFGLLFFALLTNGDVLVTRVLFAPETAATYAAVATLGKINLFVSLAVGMVLFPKAIERHQTGRPVWPLLSLAFAAALTPGAALTTLYFLFPAEIVQLVFRNEFANPGIVLGLVGLATTLFAGINLWLNYALSTQKQAYIYALGGVVAALLVSVLFFHSTLAHIGWALVGAGVLGNGAGAWVAARHTAHPSLS